MSFWENTVSALIDPLANLIFQIYNQQHNLTMYASCEIWVIIMDWNRPNFVFKIWSCLA